MKRPKAIAIAGLFFMAGVCAVAFIVFTLHLPQLLSSLGGFVVGVLAVLLYLDLRERNAR
jgi:hypothetical protein